MSSVELVKAEQEVLEPGDCTLSDLAAEANHEHGEALRAGASMVDHAILAGQALLAARDKCAPGEWTPWVAANIDANRHTVSTYMRIAHHRDAIRGTGIAHINHAKLYLKGLASPPSTRGNGVRHHSPEVRDEARRLLDGGAKPIEVARLLSVNYATVRGWDDPEYAKRRATQLRESAQKLAAKRREAKVAAREREIERSVRKAGAAEQELYAMAERMQDVMGRAHREATDREKRKHYALAGEHYRKMRDEIVRALGVS